MTRIMADHRMWEKLSGDCASLENVLLWCKRDSSSNRYCASDQVCTVFQRYRILVSFDAMIEVKARLLRGAVYMAGETIQCEVTFSNLNTTETNDCKKCNDTRENLKETSSRVETVAWASVQIHCQCSINESRVMFPNTRNRTLESTSSTSFVASRGLCYKEFDFPSLYSSWVVEMLIFDSFFILFWTGEQGHCLLSTEPKILFCDLKLAPGEVQTCKLKFSFSFEILALGEIEVRLLASVFAGVSDGLEKVYPLKLSNA